MFLVTTAFLVVISNLIFYSQSVPCSSIPSRSVTLLSVSSQVCQLAKKFKRVTNRKRKPNDIPKTVVLLSLLLLTLSHDIESNPGPVQSEAYMEGNSTVFPCGNCHLPVTWSCKGLQCDMCMVWYHADCQSITDSLYDILGDSSAGVAVWKCSLCENINVTNSSTPSLDSFETSNPFAHLDTSNMSDLSFSQANTSTPKRHITPTEPNQCFTIVRRIT